MKLCESTPATTMADASIATLSNRWEIMIRGIDDAKVRANHPGIGMKGDEPRDGIRGQPSGEAISAPATEARGMDGELTGSCDVRLLLHGLEGRCRKGAATSH